MLHLDRPILGRAAPQVQKWSHRSAHAQATAVMVVLRVELVWSMSSNNDMWREHGGGSKAQADGSSFFSSFLTTTS